MLGWARGDARALGQHTRLFARALVLERGKRQLALVAADLNMVPGGMVQSRRRAAAGFDEREVIVPASHTHAGPTGYSNFLFKDRAFPTPKAPKARASASPTRGSTRSWSSRLALAIRRADARSRPAAAGWGSTQPARRDRATARSRRTWPTTGSSAACGDRAGASEDPRRRRPHDRPGRERAARGPRARRPARARGRVGGVRQPRDRQQVDVPRTTTATTTASARPRVRGGAAAGRPRARGRTWCTCTATATPATCRRDSTAPVPPPPRGGAPRGRGDARRLARAPAGA